MVPDAPKRHQIASIAYRKSKALGNKATINVKSRLASMSNRGCRSKSCYSRYPNLSNRSTVTTRNSANDLKKLLEKQLHSNQQHNPPSKKFKKRSTSTFASSTVSKESDHLKGMNIF